MEFKGTKGDWKYTHIFTNKGDFFKIESDGVQICNITTRNLEQARNNAKIIESSKEMFKILNDVLKMKIPDYAKLEIEKILNKISEL